MTSADRFFEECDPSVIRGLRAWAEEFRAIVVKDELDPVGQRANVARRSQLAALIVAVLDELRYPHGQAVQLGDFLLFTEPTRNGQSELSYCFLPAFNLRRGA